jgi:formiminoglutamate deiminase
VVQTLFFQHALLPSGWAENVQISISNGFIASVTPGSAPQGERHAIGLPGMSNVHSHTFQRAIAGLTEYRGGAASDNFWTWREQMYRFGLQMNPDDVEAVATLAFVEMLEAGFCGVAEFHYLHHAPDGRPYDDIAELATRIAAAAAAAGIELLLLPVFYAHAGFGGLAPTPGQRRFINDLDGFARLLDRAKTFARIGIAPHSLRAVTPEELTAVVGMAAGGRIHIHVSEQTGEVEECLAWSGQRPIEFLLGHAPVGPDWCLIHATHADDTERGGMAARGAVVGLCPMTEANLGDGIFPAHDYPGAIGIGTDSNILISVAEELRMLEYVQRLTRRQRNVMAGGGATATALFTRAVSGGAQALDSVAALAPAAPANIISLAGETPDIALAKFMFCAGAGVQDVWVRGTKRVSGGQHALAASSRARFDAVVKRLA